MDACTVMRRQFSFLFSLYSYFHSEKEEGAGKVTPPCENFSVVLQMGAHFLWSQGAMELGCIEASHVCSVCLFLTITSVILLVLKTWKLLMFSLCFSSSPWICKLHNETLPMMPQQKHCRTTGKTTGKTAKIDLWGRKNREERHMNIAPALRKPELKIREIANFSFRPQRSALLAQCSISVYW